MSRLFAGGSSTDGINFGALTPNATQRSISLWFNCTATDVTTRRFWEWATTGLVDGTDNGQISSTNITISMYWSTTAGQWTIATPSTGAIHNLIITYDGSSTSNDPVVYLDGVSQTVTRTIPPVGSLTNASGNLVVGNRFLDNARAFNGMIAEYARWTRILTANEISSIANKNSPLFFPSSLTLYAIISGFTSPELDSTASISGTVTGTSQIVHPNIIYPSNGFFEFMGPQPQC